MGIENARSSPPFGDGNVILSSTKSMQFHRDSRLPDSASGIQGDLKRNLHPFRLLDQRGTDFDNLLVRYFGLLGDLVSSDFQADNGIGIRIAHANRLPNDECQNPQLVDGGISTNSFARPFLVGGTPVDVLSGVPVGNRLGRVELPELEPKREPLPSIDVTLPGPGSLAVPFQKLGHPGIPTVSLDRAGSHELIGFELGAKRSSLGRLSWIVGPKLGRLIAPLPVAVDELDEPIG